MHYHHCSSNMPSNSVSLPSSSNNRPSPLSSNKSFLSVFRFAAENSCAIATGTKSSTLQLCFSQGQRFVDILLVHTNRSWKSASVDRVSVGK